MGTFKSNLFEICREIAGEFNDWSFISGQFKNKSLGHTDLIISPGFGFKQGGSTPLQPAIWVCNKKFMTLRKEIFGGDEPTSVILFKHLIDDLKNTPEQLRGHCWIEEDKKKFMQLSPSAKEIEEKYVDIKEARSILKAMIQDGIFILDKYYNLTDEESLLHGFPPKYTPSKQCIYDEMERQKGVAMCIVRVLLGDFDFVKNYMSDEFVTIFPKRMPDLEKIIAALPVLKKRYAETGSVI